MRPSELLGLAAFIFGLSLLDGARAAESKITLYITGCEAAEIASDRLFEFARTELAPRELVIASGEPTVEAWVGEVRLCHGSPNHALIAIGTPGHRIAERVVDLSDVVGEMRGRTLAVALAEMFASTTPNAWAAAGTGATTPAPKPVEAAPAPTRSITPPAAAVPTAPPPHVESAASNRLSAGAAAREYFRPATLLVGPWLSVAGNRWLGELAFLTTSKQVANGTVALNDAHLALGYDVFAHGRSTTWVLRARGELGMVWASATPASNSIKSHSQSKAQGAGALEMLLRSPIARDLGVEARVSSGFASGITATSDGESVSSTDGVFVGLQLGLSYAWGQP